MLELPETSVLANQAQETLVGKTITRVTALRAPHRFAFFNGNPGEYPKLLEGRTITGAIAQAGYLELILGTLHLTFSDGCNLRYYQNSIEAPAKEQLRLDFSDATCLVVTVSMYGMLNAFESGHFDNPYYRIAHEKPTPYEPGFTYSYFQSLKEGLSPKTRLKAFLATEQRIPGLGNGVLQDILFASRLHPKTQFGCLSEKEWEGLYQAVITVLKQMRDQGGRKSEKDLFGHAGEYTQILAKANLGQPCPKCGHPIEGMNYLGGSVYLCPKCQVVRKS